MREQLEKDLQQARAQLQQQIQENRRITGGNAGTDSAGGHATEDLKTEVGVVGYGVSDIVSSKMLRLCFTSYGYYYDIT